MGQALAVVILLVLGRAIYNKYTKIKPNATRKNKGGEIIDISEAWISMDNLPYRRKDAIVNIEEIALFELVNSLLPDNYHLLPRVRLADILSLPGSTENRQAYQARLNDRAVDFIICSTELQPRLIIFVENDTEARKKQIRDGFVRRAIETSGIPYLNIKVNPLPDKDFLAKQLNKAGVL
ncbi:MAG: DUF2726 domain-containing protein [Methylocystaceae bacterium]